MIRRSYCLLAVALIAAPAPSQAGDPSVLGFDREGYGLAMDALSRLGEPETWYAEAAGRYMAFEHRWELEASSLYPSREDLGEAREGLRAWAVEDRARRLGDWLEDRFLGREAARLMALVADAVSEANANLLYERGADGKALMDKAGDPVYRATGDIVAERGAWRRQVGRAIGEAGAAFRLRVESLRPELLAYVGRDGAALASEALDEAAASVESRVSAELSSLASREERLFAARRSADVWSLRRGSEAETAGAVADELLRGVGETCERGLAALGSSLEGARGGADVAPVSESALREAGTDWLEAFKLQFDRGLSAWRSAEESLVLRRLAWESDAASGFREGGEAWASAFERLAADRRSWEGRLSVALELGERSFERAGDELNARIRATRLEFERDALERSVDRAETANAWIDIYRRARSSAEESAERAGYWLSRIGEGAPVAKDPGAIAALDALTASGDAERGRSIAQARSCLEAYAAFSAKAEEARARLASDLSASLSQSGPGEGDEIILRMEASASYWRRRVAIAEAVHAYAVDASAGRITEGDGLARLEAATEAYAVALAAYEAERLRVTEAGSAIDRARAVVDGASTLLAEAEAGLREANEAYGAALAALASGDDGAFLRGELRARYDELVALYGLSAADGDNAVASLAAAELACGRELGTASAEWLAGRSMERAVAGEAGERSLAELAEAVEAVRGEPLPGLGYLDPTAYGLGDSPSTSAVLAALAGFEGRLMPLLSPPAREPAIEALSRAAAAAASGEERRRGAALEARLEGIAMLGARSLEDWYGGPSPRDGRALRDALGREVELEELSALRARARLELEALDLLSGGAITPASLGDGYRVEGDASALALLACLARRCAGGNEVETNSGERGRTGDDAGYGAASRSLRAIVEVLDKGGGTEAAATGLESLASRDARAAAFLRGRGFFVVDGLDLAGLFVDASRTFGARSRLEAYERYGGAAPAMDEARRLEAMDCLDRTLSSLGLSRSADGRLAGTNEVASCLAAAMGSGGQGASTVLRAFFDGTQEAASLAPEWVAREIAAWRDSVLGLAAARGASLAIGSATGPEASRALAAEARERASDYRAEALSAKAALERAAGLLGDLYGGASRARVLAESLAVGEWSATEATMLRGELAELLAGDLASSLFEETGTADRSASLGRARALCDERFAYADEETRERAADLAMARLELAEALATRKDPGELSGEALDARLAQAWEGMDAGSIAASAREAARLSAAVSASGAFLLGELRRLGVSDREGVAALRSGGPDGEPSWLERYYGSEGEMAGVIMETLLGSALLEDASGPGQEAWSVERVEARLAAASSAPIETLGELRDALRLSMGGASVVAERLLGAALADFESSNDNITNAMIGLGLRGVSGLQGGGGPRTIAELQEEAFLGLHGEPYASQAAAHYLAGLALSGDLESLERAAAARSDAETARASRIAELRLVSGRRAGPYSGDALSWAAGASAGDPELCLALLRASESGRFDDVLAELRGLGPRRGEGDPLSSWLAGRLEERRRALELDAGLAAYWLACAEASSEALGAACGAASGRMHWRLALRDIAAQGSPGASDGGLESALEPRAPVAVDGYGVDAEGALADALTRSAIAAHRLEAALLAWALPVEAGERRLALHEAAALLAGDPSGSLDTSLLPTEALPEKAEYLAAKDRYLGLGARAKALQAEIARLGSVLAAAAGGSASEAALGRLEASVAEAEARYGEALSACKAAGTALTVEGTTYDSLKASMARAYDELDAARLELDSEEAVSLWAGSAYLESGAEARPPTGGARKGADTVDGAEDWLNPVEELRRARESLRRAEEALSIVRMSPGPASSTGGEAYEAAMAAYGEDCRLSAMVAEARAALGAETARAGESESAAHRSLVETLFREGSGAMAATLSYSDYKPPTDAAARWKDFLRVAPDGRLGLAFGADFALVPVDAGMATRLADYLGEGLGEPAPGAERSLTPYMMDMLGWSSRAKDYLADPARHEAWILAREYLVARLVSSNSRYAGLASAEVRADHLRATVGQERLLGKSCAEHLDGFDAGLRAARREAAWNALGREERADLEFFTLLTLTGGAEVCRKGLEASALLAEYGLAQELVIKGAGEAAFLAKNLGVTAMATAALGAVLCWTPAGPALLALSCAQFGLMALAETESSRLKMLDSSFLAPRIAEQKAERDAGRQGLLAGFESVLYAGARYESARARLSAARGAASSGACDAEAFGTALVAGGRVDPASITALVEAYETMLATIPAMPGNAAAALEDLGRFSAVRVESSRSAVERAYEAIEARRKAANATLAKAIEAFLAGEADAETLGAAASERWASDGMALGRHIEGLAEASALAGFAGEDEGSRSAYAGLGARAALARSQAELSALEASWGAERRSLEDRRESWMSGLRRSLALGREDFARSEELMRARASAWELRFGREYVAKAEAWEERMAEFDEARLYWALEASEAATAASSGALLACVGADAEAAARYSESRDVSALAVACGAAEAANEALALTRGSWARLGEALAGAARLERAPLPTAIRAPASGSWDSGTARALAADFSGRSYDRLAGLQSLLLAAATSRAASEAVSELDETLRRANEGFAASMDGLFSRAAWRREGGAYVKDVVVHSTLGSAYISERASVEAYRTFDPGPWSLSVDLSEARLSRLDATSLRGLVAAAHEELRSRSEELFGRAAERDEADSVAARTRTFYQKRRVAPAGNRARTDGKDRGQGTKLEVPCMFYEEVDDTDNPITRIIEPGAFGAYLGHDPVLRDGADAASVDPFIDPGLGELGRLVGSYLRWALVEGKGWAEAGKPIYDKDLWDDRGWAFEATTLRGLADISLGIVAGALSGGSALPALLASAGLGLTDDLAFGVLDVAGGYRSIEEAGLAFGIKAGTQAASLLAFGLVNGYGGPCEGFFAKGLSGALVGMDSFSKDIGLAVLNGGASLLAGSAGSALGALELRYDTDEHGKPRISGLGWSQEAMDRGMKALFLSAAGSALGTTVKGSLDLGLEGFTGSLYDGGRALSALAGGLSGEAVRLALGGDACVNLLDIGILGLTGSGGSSVRGGLLELRLGSRGLSLALGAGGAGVGPDALMAAAGGLEAWGVNAELLLAGLGKDPRLASALRSLRSEGSLSGDERNLYERVRIGQTRVVENPDAHYGAITEYDEESGLHTIVLGRKALRDHSRFGLNATLAHEAHRNGVDDGAEAQRAETERAVVGHIGILGSLARAYGDGALSDSQFAELSALRESEAGNPARLALVIGAYDAGRDHWKLLADGRLINDNQRRLLMEVVSDDGKTGRWLEVEGSSGERSVAAALVRYLGEGRAAELLGSGLDDLDTYDDQTLGDVLDLDEEEIRRFRTNPGDAARLLSSLGAFQRQRLLGEALMKRAGIAWNAKAGAWEGEGVGLTLSGEPLPGPAAVRALGDGRYERFAISCGMERGSGAYAAWRDGAKGDLAQGNTRIVFTKWDLDTGESVADLVAPGAWNSVDNSSGQLDKHGRPIGTHHPYSSPAGALLQADTLAAGDFSMRWSFDGSASIEDQDILIIAGAGTIAGDSIGADGRRPGHAFEDRWLFHDTDYGSSDGCIVHRSGEGMHAEYRRLFAYLESWGLVRGYSMPTDLVDLGAGELGLGNRKGSVW